MADKDLYLVAGASRVAIPFPEGFFPHKSFRGRYFTGIHDDLFVRALYMINSDAEELLFISIDVGDVHEKIIDPISRRTGIAAGHIFIMATHTHAAPHFGGTWEEDVIDRKQSEEFAALCLESIVAAADQARRSARRACVYISCGSCEINVNRDYKYSGTDGRISSPYISAPNPAGIKNHELIVLQFKDEQGITIACLVNYPVHSNVTFYQTWIYGEGMLVSGDLAGVAMRYTESHSDPGTVSLFAMGAAADQIPKYISNHRVFDKDGNASWEYYGQKEGLLLAEVQGTELGRAVIESIRNECRLIKNNTIRIGSKVITEPGKIAGTGGMTDVSEGKASDYRAQYKEDMKEDFKYVPDADISMVLQLIRLGDLMIAVVPAEIVTSTGIEIKNVVKEITGAETIVISQCNGSYSYISDEDGYRKRTFEAVASHFMPGIADVIVKGFGELADMLR